jgi:MerR family transcriptional regulator, light-induced transcriptional regulator
MEAEATGYVRIGELSRRSGVSTDLLRAWERRYGLLRPTRSEGGFRLYSPQDEQRVALMRDHLERGLSAAQAARLILDETERRPDESPALARGAESLRQALDALDESDAHTALDTLLANLSLETVLGEVVMPYLHELGERWERGEASVADEHFASNLLRGRLLGLARGWDRGLGPRALLACAPGEQHDLALIVFGLALRERGWRITYLGPDTPIDSLENAARTLEPAAVVIAVTTSQRLVGTEASLRKLARSVPLWIAGAGASPKATEKAGARHLDADPLGGADLVAQAHPPLR